jgi:hypothetical protein
MTADKDYESRPLLGHLAKGAPSARLIRDAVNALRRLPAAKSSGSK